MVRKRTGRVQFLVPFKALDWTSSEQTNKQTKRADQVQGAHFGLKKSCPKMTKNNFFGCSLFCLCLVRIFVFYRFTIETKVEKMAANTKVCTFEWPGL